MKNIVLILLATTTWVHAQQPTDTLSEKESSRYVNIKHPAKFLLHSVIAVSYTGAVLLCYKNADATIQHESQEGKNQIKNQLAGSVSPLGLGKVHALASGSSFALALITKNKRLQHASTLWMESLLLNGQITNFLKTNFQRSRPNTGLPYNTFDGDDGPNTNHSFPSAHTSNAFTTATIFATLYKDKKWVAPVAYSMATMVGLSRIYNNAHWASDVMTGAAVGFLSAKAVIGLNKMLDKKHIHLYPQIGKRNTALALTYDF